MLPICPGSLTRHRQTDRETQQVSRRAFKEGIANQSARPLNAVAGQRSCRPGLGRLTRKLL
jgi:hypothetical protein